MDPTTVGTRIASTAIAPLIKRLFRQDGPGAGLVDKPVRVSSLVSFKGEKHTLSTDDLRKIGKGVFQSWIKANEGQVELSAEAQRDMRFALGQALSRLGSLDMDDVQAVQLGPDGLARQLRGRRSDFRSFFSTEVWQAHNELLQTVCLHILNFFTQRSTFVARTLVEQSQQLDRAIARIDLLIERNPHPLAADTDFERRYTTYIATRHRELTIFGLDLDHAREWPLDASYVSLQAETPSGATTAPARADELLVRLDRPRVLLRGVAGSGKTTLAQWLAVTAVHPDPPETPDELLGRIPFLLPLRALPRLPAPRDFLAATGCPHSPPDGWAERVLSVGRGLLLIDGVDEVPETEREATRRWLRDLLAAFPTGNRWLVTSRPSAIRQDWLTDHGFAELSLSPMSRDDVATFIDRWHAATGTDPALAAELRTAVRTKQELGRLATNPLMCGLICALHRERHGFLPQGRKELYDAALSMLLDRRDTERRVRPTSGRRLPREPQVQLLQKLAYWMIRNGRSEMERADAIAVLASALPAMPYLDADAATLYRYLLERSGLLREPSEGRVDFIHRTFQDYLGGRMAVEELDFPLLVENAHRDQWEDVFRMAVAHARPLERARLLTELIDVPHGDPSSDRQLRRRRSDRELRQLLVAAASLEHATELDPAVREAVERRLSTFIPPRGPNLARNLADLGGPLALDLLPGPEGLSDDEAYHVVSTAVRIATDAAIPLLARYAAHPSMHVRRELVNYWGSFDTERYAAEVIAYLDPADLDFPVADADELAALRALGGRERIWLTGHLPPSLLIAGIVADRLTYLHLQPVYAQTSLEWLAAFPRLEVVHFSGRRRPVHGVPDSIRVTWH